MEEEVQDKIFRREGAWKTAVEAIKNAVDVGIQVRINCTAYYETLSQVEALTKFAKEVCAYKLRINPYVPCADLPPVSPELTKKTVEIVRCLEAEGYPVYTPINPDDKLPNYMICSAGLTKAVIETDGSVGGCQFMGDYPKSAGNITKESFFDIWTKGNWDYYRKDLEKEKMQEPCVNCDMRTYCISNCIAYAKALLGDGKVLKKVKCPF
jgi:radical SAM protein with 4Fe4S-binding SPASM domain